MIIAVTDFDSSETVNSRYLSRRNENQPVTFCKYRREVTIISTKHRDEMIVVNKKYRETNKIIIMLSHVVEYNKETGAIDKCNMDTLQCGI